MQRLKEQAAALDFQEKVGLLQWVPKMADIFSHLESQFFYTCVSLGGYLVVFRMKAILLFLDLGQVGGRLAASDCCLIGYNK